MFGRRRRAVPVVPVPAPQLTAAQLHDIIHERMSGFLGSHGEWVVSRRSPEDTDSIFADILAESISTQVTVSITRAIEATIASWQPVQPTSLGRASHAAESAVHHVTQADDSAPVAAEPVALTWIPTPIAVWAEPVPEPAPPAAVSDSSSVPADRQLVA